MSDKLLKLIIAPLVVMIVGGITVYLAKRGLEPQEPPISVTGRSDSLVLTNNTDQILSVRVAYIVTDNGVSSYCYPFETRATGQSDPKLFPGDSKPFPPGRCQNVNINDHAIWAWGPEGDLVFHFD